MYDGSQFELELREELQQYKIPKSWVDEIEAIKESILHKNVLISLVGEQNGGKSTFAKLLYLALQPLMKPYYFSASMLFDNDIFLAQIQAQLGLSNCRHLKDMVTQIHHKQQATLLIIDEAQHIPETFLIEILSALQSQGEGQYFHVCLISHTNALTPINSHALAEYANMIETHALKYLTEEETQVFVQHRIAKLGYPMPTIESIRDFYHLTEGNLVEMNSQFDLFFKQKEYVNTTKIWYWGGAVTLVVSLVFAFFMAPLPEESMTVTMQSLPEPTVVAVEKQAVLPILTSEIPPFFMAAQHTILHTIPFKTQKLELDNESDPFSNEKLAVVDKVVVAPKIIKQPVKTVAPVKKGQFTIQLIASSHMATLKQFVVQNHLKGATIKTSTLQGRTWYILAYGQYQTREQAKAALLHLPSNLLKNRPWVRASLDLKSIG